MFLQPGPHRGPRAGVAYDEESVRGETRHDHIIDDRPVVAEQMRVPRLARRGRDVIRAQAIQKRMCLGSFGKNLAHVADIEQADGTPHREMLVHDSGILQWHLPSAELDEARARCGVPPIERRAQSHARRQRAERMKAFSPAKLMHASLIARGHHGHFP